MPTMNRILLGAVCVIVAVGVDYCMKGATNKNQAGLTLTSTAFNNGSPIPTLYTCDGQNISPELSWSLQSTDTVKSYVLIVDDPDARHVVGKTFVHWVVIFSGTTTSIPEGGSGNLHATDMRAVELLNHSEKPFYQGPCPPPGSGVHHYRFTLFATTQPVENIEQLLQAPCTAEECKKRLAGTIVAETLLTGTYTRNK